MTENELREQIKAEILDGLKFETFRGARIATAICVTVLVDDGKNPAQAVCRFYLPNGVFVGEVPANKIITAENSAQTW
ncbi:MAG: hypothetical protein IJ774_08335 [Selenomonadaceae bacterium]|nr:hypothetical protein [Selenomonadaceae bacterium]